MKRYVLSIILMTMFLSTAVFSQEPGEHRAVPHENMQHMQHQMPPPHMPPPPEKHEKEGPHLLLLLVLVVHILVAVWVYQDIRQRNSGSGIWIVVALLTGLLGVLVYAIVRLGDTREKKT